MEGSSAPLSPTPGSALGGGRGVASDSRQGHLRLEPQTKGTTVWLDQKFTKKNFTETKNSSQKFFSKILLWRRREAPGPRAGGGEPGRRWGATT